MSKWIGEELMHKKSLVVGIFLLACLLFLGVGVLQAEAEITLDGTNKEIELSAGAFDLDLIWDHPSVSDTHLVNGTDSTWILNWSIVVETDATLVIDPVTGNDTAVHCTWLKMNSTNLTGKGESHISVEGRLFVNDTTITGWNYTGNCNQSWNGTSCTFRPYIYISASSATPRAYFLNSTIGYLGYDVDNKYGIVYEDAESGEPWGWMHNCTVLENFHGINFQGCENMNVTNTWMNNTKEVGIVYTVSGTGGGSHGGFVGDHPSWTHRALYTSVAVDYCSGDATAMGIRLCNSNNISFNSVVIQDAYTDGLWIEECNNITANNTVSYLNTNAADDYNIYLYNCTNSSFTNCTAYTPDGDTDGGNWMLAGGGWNNSNHNNFTECRGYGATSSYDFHVWHSDGNLFINCYANHSAYGYYVEHGHNNSFIDCEGRTHTYYNFKLYGTQYNEITGGYANISAIGILIADDTDTYVSHHNAILGVDVNLATGYAVSIGTDGGADNICHNNTVTSVIVAGTTTGDGFFFFDNVTYNNVTGCVVTSLDHTGSCAFGMSNDAHHNIFYGSLANGNENTGFALMQTANHNSILGCIASLCQEGLEMSGDDIHNNTIDNFYSHHNDWGLWAWSSASNNNKDNYVNNSRFQFNTYAGMDIGRIGLSTYYNNTVKNNSFGIEVRQGAEPFFSLTLSYNSTNYDWVIENTSTVDIYSTHILYPDVINTVATVTASISHDAGVGLWNLYTMPMIITIDEGTCDINVTQYTDAYVQWTGTALAGNLTQYVGGLREGRVYNLLVDGVSIGRASAVEVTRLENTTYEVAFVYVDDWSTKTFAVRMITGAGNGGAPAEEPSVPLDSDGDGWTDAEEIAAGSDPYDPASTPLTVAAVAFLGLDWYWWIVIAVIIFFVIIMPIYFILYPKQWKKFKKSLGF